jgi:hypothetical protein
VCRPSVVADTQVAESQPLLYLHERSEGGQPGAGPDHDDGRGGILRQPEVRIPADVHWQLVAHLQQGLVKQINAALTVIHSSEG